MLYFSFPNRIKWIGCTHVWVCFVALLCYGTSLNAQDNDHPSFAIQGTVFDASTGEKLNASSIEIRTATNELYSTVANNYGYFSITLPQGRCIVYVNSAGYVNTADTLSLFSNVQKDYFLVSKKRLLEEVVVTSIQKRIANPELAVHKVSVADIKKLPAVLGEVDILKALQFLPGISTTGENSVSFSVRGGNTDQNLILLDEAPIYNPSHVFGLFSIFNSNAIKDFTLYKGGIPGRYGGRLSSVLDVRQYDGSKNKLQIDGGIGLLSTNLSIQGPLYKKKGADLAHNSFFISGRRSYFDLFLGFSNEANIKNTKIYFYDLNAKLNWKLGKSDELFLSGFWGEDYFALPSQFGFGWSNITSTLRWNHTYRKNFFSNLSLVYSNYDYKISFFTTNFDFQWRGIINNLFFKGMWEYARNSKTKFNFGFNANYIHTTPGEIAPLSDSSAINAISIQKEKGIETALFLEMEKKLGKRWQLHGGLRLEWFGRFGSQTVQQYQDNQAVVFNRSTQTYGRATPIGETVYKDGDLFFQQFALSPRFNLSYVLSPPMSLKFSYNRMVQYMQTLSVSSTAVPTDIYRLAGTYIKPAKADQISVGYFLNVPVKQKEDIELSVEGFYKWFTDAIDYIDGANIILNETVETELLPSKGYAYGMEFLFNKNFGKLSGWLSYTYSKSIYQSVPTLGGNGINNGKDYATSFDVPHNFSVVGTYNVSKRVSMSVAFVLRSGKTNTYPEARYEYSGYTIPLYGGRNEYRLPTYHRLDLSLTLLGKPRKRFETKWVFSIYNVYNHYNPYTIFFQQSRDQKPGVIPTTQGSQISIYGIVPSVTWEFHFK